MTQKEKLETLTGEKFPEPTPQEQKRIQLKNSPFWVIGNDNNGYHVVMGKWKLNKEPLDFAAELQENDTAPLTDTEITDMAHAWLHDNLYNTILAMILCITTDMLNNQYKQ